MVERGVGYDLGMRHGLMDGVEVRLGVDLHVPQSVECQHGTAYLLEVGRGVVCHECAVPWCGCLLYGCQPMVGVGDDVAQQRHEPWLELLCGYGGISQQGECLPEGIAVCGGDGSAAEFGYHLVLAYHYVGAFEGGSGKGYYEVDFRRVRGGINHGYGSPFAVSEYAYGAVAQHVETAQVAQCRESVGGEVDGGIVGRAGIGAAASAVVVAQHCPSAVCEEIGYHGKRLMTHDLFIAVMCAGTAHQHYSSGGCARPWIGEGTGECEGAVAEGYVVAVV